jgi:hypothetical protein
MIRESPVSSFNGNVEISELAPQPGRVIVTPCKKELKHKRAIFLFEDSPNDGT